jgi:hypothetical protein
MLWFLFLAGGPKALRREIDRRLDYVAHIRHEPPLTCDVDDPSQLRTRYRVAAVEEIRCVKYVANYYYWIELMK